MTSLAAARVIFPLLFRPELENGPFVFCLTDLHRSNILVNEDWHITCIIDLEFDSSWPVEFLQPPYWLGGGSVDEVEPETFAPKHAVFLQHLKHEEEEVYDGISGTEPSFVNYAGILDEWVVLGHVGGYGPDCIYGNLL
jgi:hypothetical protein